MLAEDQTITVHASREKAEAAWRRHHHEIVSDNDQSNAGASIAGYPQSGTEPSPLTAALRLHVTNPDSGEDQDATLPHNTISSPDDNHTPTNTDLVNPVPAIVAPSSPSPADPVPIGLVLIDAVPTNTTAPSDTASTPVDIISDTTHTHTPTPMSMNPSILPDINGSIPPGGIDSNATYAPPPAAIGSDSASQANAIFPNAASPTGIDAASASTNTHYCQQSPGSPTPAEPPSPSSSSRTPPRRGLSPMPHGNTPPPAGIAAVFVGDQHGQLETNEEHGSMAVSFAIHGMLSFVSGS